MAELDSETQRNVDGESNPELSPQTYPAKTGERPTSPGNESARYPSPASLILSTILSLMVVLVLLVVLRLMLPSMLEMSRYSWHRGRLRAEYEIAGQQLERVSRDGVSVSQMVAQRVFPSVVHITLDTDAGLLNADESSIRRSLKKSMVGQGSGVIVDHHGHILTNYHVINDEDAAASPKRKINVLLADERSCQANLVGFDAARDLAVLKIDATQLMPISWGDSDVIDIGSPVWAVGSPFGLAGSITFGILSGKHRLDLSGTSYDEQRFRQRFTDDVPRNRHLATRYADLMQSDVAVNPGNSGGPLVNSKGELIGINTAIIGEAYRGVSFSIPSNVAKLAFEQIVLQGKMKPGWLGVELVKVSVWEQQIASLGSESSSERSVSVDNQPSFPTRGAVIRRIVSEDSPAALAGLQVGDYILAINNQSVKGVDDLIFAIGKTTAGGTIQLLVQRDGTQRTMDVIVSERPEIR